jgi:uncharacterized protein
VHTDEGYFEWDAEKAQANLQKHGVSFGQAVEAFSDERAVIIENPFPFEERFSLVGMDMLGRVLVVVYAWRGSRIRLISARRATSNERRQYEGE